MEIKYRVIKIREEIAVCLIDPYIDLKMDLKSPADVVIDALKRAHEKKQL